MLNKLTTKRILSGLTDIIIMIAIDKIILLSEIRFSGAATFYYFYGLYQYNTTIGGALFNTRITDNNNDDLGNGRKIFRGLIFSIAFYTIASSLANHNYIWSLSALSIITLPIFFTKNTINLIDFFSRSRVIQDPNDSFKEYKKENALALISAIIIFISFTAYFSIRSTNCLNWFNKQEYRLVIEKCEKVTKMISNPEMHFMLGISYSSIGQYDKAIKLIRKSELIGVGNVDFAIAGIYVEKGDYDKAIEIANKNLNSIKMLSILAMTYAAKSHFENSDDIITAYAYSKAVSLKSKSLSDVELQNDKDLPSIIDLNYRFANEIEKTLNNSEKIEAKKKIKEIMDKIN